MRMNLTRKKIYRALLLFGTLIEVTSVFATTKISRVEFFGKSSPNQLVVVGDGPIEFEKIENPADKQVIFEIKNARLANSNASRRLDTSSFNSKVSLISPYNVEGKDAVRIIVQMREGADISTLAEGSRLYVGIDGAADPNILPTASTPTAGAPRKNVKSTHNEKITLSTSAEVAPSATPEGRIDQFLDASQTKKYLGRHITLQVKDADLVDVFKLIGETSGFNMVIGSDVTGKVNLSLVDVPWDLVLDTILTTNKLGAERTGNIMRVASLAMLTQEKVAQLAAKTAAENTAPRITRIFPLSYAGGKELMPVLSRFGGGQAGATGAAARDTIILDDRTNSLIIQDTSDNLERMAKIIKLLDRQTPQIQIEGKIVVASETFTKTLGGNFGITAAPAFGSVGGSFLEGLASQVVPGLSASGKAGNSLGMNLTIAPLANLRLSALLNLAEQEGKTRVISSPRTVVLNKTSSTIVQSQPVLVPVTTTNPANGSTMISTEVKAANLSLAVTPTVTNDGNVVMKLNIANDTSLDMGNGQTGISNRNISTEVVVESGSTIAIGGIYTMSERSSETGIPFLRKLPIIGTLFGNETKGLDRSELFIFVTPRILNEEVMSKGVDLETKQSSALRSSPRI